jgi:hypothetical protein
VTQKLTNTDRYSATPDQMIAMMSDPDYLTAKYTELGDVTFNVETQTATADSLELKVSRSVNADLPGALKKIMGDTNDLVQSESWSTGGTTKTADVVIDAPGKPINISGTYKVVPVGDTDCDYVVDFKISASIPLVGGKIEKMVKAENAAMLPREKAFNDKWIAEH